MKHRQSFCRFFCQRGCNGFVLLEAIVLIAAAYFVALSATLWYSNLCSVVQEKQRLLHVLCVVQNEAAQVLMHKTAVTGERVRDGVHISCALFPDVYVQRGRWFEVQGYDERYPVSLVQVTGFFTV